MGVTMAPASNGIPDYGQSNNKKAKHRTQRSSIIISSPRLHVDEQNSECDSILTRIFENNKDEGTKDWIESLKALNKKICEYVEKYFKLSGLEYNAKGESLIDAKEIVRERKEKLTKSDLVKQSIFRLLHYLFIQCKNLELLD